MWSADWVGVSGTTGQYQNQSSAWSLWQPVRQRRMRLAQSQSNWRLPSRRLTLLCCRHTHTARSWRDQRRGGSDWWASYPCRSPSGSGRGSECRGRGRDSPAARLALPPSPLPTAARGSRLRSYAALPMSSFPATGGSAGTRVAYAPSAASSSALRKDRPYRSATRNPLTFLILIIAAKTAMREGQKMGWTDEKQERRQVRSLLLAGSEHEVVLGDAGWSSEFLDLLEELLLAGVEVRCEGVALAVVVQLAQVEAGLSVDDAPHCVFDFLKVGLVHALEAFPQAPIAHHLVYNLLENGFLHEGRGTRQTLPWRCFWWKAGALWMPLRSAISRKRWLRSTMQAMNCVTSSSVARSASGSSRFSWFSREDSRTLMVKRFFSPLECPRPCPYYALMVRQIIQQHSPALPFSILRIFDSENWIAREPRTNLRLDRRKCSAGSPPVIEGMQYYIMMSGNLSLDRLKRLELHYIEIESVSLSSFSGRRQLPPVFAAATAPENSVVRRVAGQEVKSCVAGATGSLLAYAYMLLGTVYGSCINEPLLQQVKSLLYDPLLSLTAVRNHPFPDLSSDEMKKLVVEFIFELQFTDHTRALPRALTRYPVVLHVFALFLRCLLSRFGVVEAQDYLQPIPAESAFEALSELLDIPFRPLDACYLFTDSHCIIQETAKQVLVGHYVESKPASLASEPSQPAEDDPEELKPAYTRKLHNFNFESNIRESLHDHDAPTPFFNLSGEQRLEARPDRQEIELNGYSSVPELKFGFRVSEDEENEANQSFEEKLALVRSEENGWKSPIFNDGLILDDADNAFSLFETANAHAFARKPSQPQPALPCACLPAARLANRLHSRAYEVNVLTCSQPPQSPYDCEISSIKNVFSMQSQPAESPRNKVRRADTFYQLHHSISDFDRSFDSYDQRATSNHISKAYGQPMPKPAVYTQKRPQSRVPRINFSYVNNRR